MTERWLARIAAPLAAVAAEESPAPERLRRWLDLLIAAKRRLALDDPELFATYLALAAEARAVVQAHVDHLVGQLAQIIADGVARGEFVVADPAHRRAGGLRRDRPLPQPGPRAGVVGPRHRRRLRGRVGAHPGRVEHPHGPGLNPRDNSARRYGISRSGAPVRPHRASCHFRDKAGQRRRCLALQPRR